MRWRPWYIAIPLVSFGASVVATALGLPLREFILIGFLSIGPGAAITWLAGVRDRAAWLALVVPISLSLDLLVTSALLYFGIWSPELAVALITVVTVVAIAFVPYERGARVALIAIALLPVILLVAAELAPEASSTLPSGDRHAVGRSGHTEML